MPDLDGMGVLVRLRQMAALLIRHEWRAR